MLLHLKHFLKCSTVMLLILLTAAPLPAQQMYGEMAAPDDTGGAFIDPGQTSSEPISDVIPEDAAMPGMMDDDPLDAAGAADEPLVQEPAGPAPQEDPITQPGSSFIDPGQTSSGPISDVIPEDAAMPGMMDDDPMDDAGAADEPLVQEPAGPAAQEDPITQPGGSTSGSAIPVTAPYDPSANFHYVPAHIGWDPGELSADLKKSEWFYMTGLDGATRAHRHVTGSKKDASKNLVSSIMYYETAVYDPQENVWQLESFSGTLTETVSVTSSAEYNSSYSSVDTKIFKIDSKNTHARVSLQHWKRDRDGSGEMDLRDDAGNLTHREYSRISEHWERPGNPNLIWGESYEEVAEVEESLDKMWGVVRSGYLHKYSSLSKMQADRRLHTIRIDEARYHFSLEPPAGSKSTNTIDFTYGTAESGGKTIVYVSSVVDKAEQFRFRLKFLELEGENNWLKIKERNYTFTTALRNGQIVPASFTGSVSDLEKDTNEPLNITWGPVTRAMPGMGGYFGGTVTTWEVTSATAGAYNWTMEGTEALPGGVLNLINSVLGRMQSVFGPGYFVNIALHFMPITTY